MSLLGAAGWTRFPADARSLAWARAARSRAEPALRDPANRHWLQCEGTWFVGVNLLDTAPTGAIDGIPLAGPAPDAIQEAGRWPAAWDRAQVSVIWPGYPRPREGELATAFRYRRDRDAAHVDGLMRDGPDRRRFAREFHGFILGLPLSTAGPGASPFVIWEGSHAIIAEALRRVLEDAPVEAWPHTDITEAYLEARRAVFDRCRRVEIHAQPGQAYLVHRLALHGVAPWQDGAEAEAAGRMIAYFRPQTTREDWLFEP
jgi:hypothetical protein